MTKYTSSDAEQNFKEVVSAAQQAPVQITDPGEDSVFVISEAQFRQLSRQGERRFRSEIKAGFDQLDQGEVANKSVREIRDDVRREFLNSINE
jgi:PHD/YefM family antitoxin component YafN of YafNO toxin-antitoxin module